VGSHGLEHEFGEVMDSLVMSVVAKREHVSCCRVGRRIRDVVSEVILRVLDQGRIIIQVVECVKVIIYSVVADGRQATKALAIAVNVRRAKVCWKIA
jgi:hypothetical protein